MAGARTHTLAHLQGQIDRIEGGVAAGDVVRVPLGHDAADAALGGGLMRGALHEVYAADGRQQGAVTGFVLGLVHRIAKTSQVTLWVRQDFAAQEAGELSMSGFAELGFDPRQLIIVHAADVQMALRVTADALACHSLGAVVVEICGETHAYDLAASRRYTLAAAESHVTGLMLRMNASVQPSAAETRWIVRTAHSPPVAAWQVWGAPVLDVELARNRHGPTGRWIMTWNSDAAAFGDISGLRNIGQAIGGKATTAAHSQPVAAAPAYGSHSAVRPHREQSIGHAR